MEAQWIVFTSPQGIAENSLTRCLPNDFIAQATWLNGVTVWANEDADRIDVQRNNMMGHVITSTAKCQGPQWASCPMSAAW